MKNIVTFIVIVTFLWSNVIWAGGGVSSDTLAPKSNLPALYLPVQVDILAREALRALNKEGVIDNRTLYQKRQRIEEGIGKVMKGSGDKIRFLVFPDLERANERAYYVFNMDEDFYIRITTEKDVKDRFQDILNNIDEPRAGGIKEVDEYYYEVFVITQRIKPFILECLEKIYPIVKPPEVKAEKEKPPKDKKRFLQEPNNVCNPDIWEKYKFSYGRFIGDSFNALREIEERVKVSIVVPMYKEEVRLKPKSQENPFGEDAFRRKVLQLEACRLINPLLEWELIFVDNGTPGGASGKLVERLWKDVQEECKGYGIELAPQQVKVLYITPEEARQMGSIKGGAVYEGMRYAVTNSNPDVVFYTDCDISTDLRQIGLLLGPILFNKTDIAIGSRWLPGSLRDKKAIIDIVASRLYNFIVRLLLPIRNIKDTQCGFKAFRRKMLETILPYASDNGFSFDTELLTLSKKIGSRIEEVPIAWFRSSVETKVDLLRDAFRMILGLWRQRQFFYRTGIKVKLEPENINIRSFIKCLCLKETAINLPVEERLDLLSKSLSILLKRNDAEDIADELRISLIAEKEELLPEARMMIESYLAVYEIEDPITIAVCVALWGGQKDFRDEPPSPLPLPSGERVRVRGWLSTKVNQLFRELLSINPKVDGFMVFVNDGDDSKDEKKTSDVIRGLLRNGEYDDVKDKIYVLDLPQEDKQKMGSIKHGALACGMRFSAGIGADLIMYTDSDLSSHLGLSGLLIQNIINGKNDVAFGSIGKKDAVVPYRAFWRNLGTVIYNWWVRLLLRPIRDIKDTQRSFKMFRREVLEKILPVQIAEVNEDGLLKIAFDPNFLYNFTGDTEWIGRARILGYNLDEIPIVWIDSPKTSTVDFWKQVIPMFIGAWLQRGTQEIFRGKTSGHRKPPSSADAAAITIFSIYIIVFASNSLLLVVNLSFLSIIATIILDDSKSLKFGFRSFLNLNPRKFMRVYPGLIESLRGYPLTDSEYSWLKGFSRLFGRSNKRYYANSTADKGKTFADLRWILENSLEYKDYFPGVCYDSMVALSAILTEQKIPHRLVTTYPEYVSGKNRIPQSFIIIDILGVEFVLDTTYENYTGEVSGVILLPLDLVKRHKELLDKVYMYTQWNRVIEISKDSEGETVNYKISSSILSNRLIMGGDEIDKIEFRWEDNHEEYKIQLLRHEEWGDINFIILKEWVNGEITLLYGRDLSSLKTIKNVIRVETKKNGKGIVEIKVYLKDGSVRVIKAGKEAVEVSTLKAPTTDALMHKEIDYIKSVIKDSNMVEFPKELINELRRRGPPFEGLVDALEKKKLRLFVVNSPLFGIPRYEGAVLARDTIPAYSIPDKQGNLCVHITSELYESLWKDYGLFSFVLDNEFYEKGSIPHKTHRQVWRERGWLGFFVDKKTGINKFLKLYIDRLTQEGDIEGLDRFEPFRDRYRKLVYRYVKRKKKELLNRDKVFLTIKTPDEKFQALNDMWRLSKASNENGINLQVQSDKFENEEVYVYISNPEYVKGKDCMLFFDNLDSNEEVVKLLFTVGLLEDCGARSISFEFPKDVPDWLRKVLGQFKNPSKRELPQKGIEHILFMPDTENFKPVDMPNAMDITIDEEGNIILPEDLKDGDNCLLVYSTDVVNGLLRLFEVLSVLEERGINIELFIPHFSYMRQHKSYRMKKHGRFAVSNNSTRVILKAISRFTRRIYTANIHFSKEPGFMDVKSEFPDLADAIEIYNLNLFPMLAEYFRDKGKMDNPIIVSADKGGDIYCRDTAKKTGIEYGGHMDKERDPSKPVHLQVRMIMPDIDVKDRDVILLDDIISSGTTIINAALLLKSRGAKRVFVGCVYGEFTYGIGIFNNRRMRYKQMELLKKLGQLSDEQMRYLGRCKLIDGIVSTDIMPNRTSAIFIKDLLKDVINTRNKDMHRGKVDELKETHPALENAANSGRMFALHIETARDIKKFFYLDNEDMVNIFLGFLQNLDNPIETRNKMLQRLSDPVFRGNLITGFQMMYDSIKDKPLPKDKPIRLCIVIEDEGLPTIVFKDPFNNLISHSGRGEKTNIPYISIYAGYNSIKVAIARKMEEGFKELIRHELRDIIRRCHVDDYPQIVNEFYNKVILSTIIPPTCNEEALELFEGLDRAVSGKKDKGQKPLPPILVIKTFKGIRIEMEDIPQNVRRTIGFVARWMDMIQGRGVDLLPSDLSKKYYVLVDGDRFEIYKETIDEVSKKWNVDFITEIPEGVSEKEVVALVDPGDSDKWQGIEFRYHLPIPYMFISFNLAAELASSESELENTDAFRFVKGFYENFLGTPLEDEEVLMWFSSPGRLKERMLSLKEEVRLLRLAIKELESSV